MNSVTFEQTATMSTLRKKRKRKWILLALCLLVLALIAWFTGAIGSRRPVTILRDNASFENAVSGVLNKLPSGPRDSLRKLKFRLFGPPRMVSLDANIVNFYDVPATVADALDLGLPTLGGNDGVQIWIVPHRQIADADIYSRAERIASPKAVSFSGHQALMAITTTMPAGPSGYTIDLLPRVRNEITDLSVRVQHLDPPGTNTLVAARLNLPKDSGAIILKQNPTNPTNTLGIFLLPTLPQTKK